MNKLYLTLFLLVIGMGLFLFAGSNRMATKVERMLLDDAIAVLGLAVEVDQVEFHLASGKAEITGLRIANPDGFPSSHVFDMSRISVDISLPSLLPAILGWRPYHVENIFIEAPVIYVDIDDKGRSNLDMIIQKAKTPPATDATAGDQPDSTDNTENARGNQAAAQAGENTVTSNELARIKVDELTINELAFKLHRPGKDQKSGSLAPVHMENIGGNDGITAGGLGVQISTRLASDILTAVFMNEAQEKLNSKAPGIFRLFKNK